MKKFFTKSKIKKSILSLVLLLASLFFAACSFSDTVPTEEEGGTSYIAGIDGFKVTYRPEMFEVADFYFNFSQEIMLTLATAFGNAQFETETKVIDSVETTVVPFIYEEYMAYRQGLPPEDSAMSYKSFEEAQKIYFFDDIRNSVYISEDTPQEATVEQYLYYSDFVNARNSWKWSHKIEENNLHGYELRGSNYKNASVFFEEIMQNPMMASVVFFTYNNQLPLRQERQSYYNFYAQTYAKALQVAILEILLEKQPTQFSFNYTTNQVMPNPDTLLGNGTSQGLKFEYKKNVEFIGISELAKNQITNYLVESVIGSQKYTSPESSFDKEDYEFLIDELIWQGALEEYYFSNEEQEQINNPSLGSIYNVYPAVMVQDFPAYSLFVKSNDNDAFSHIPSGQYRSIVLMPSKTDYLYTLLFYVVASRQFDINMHYRYYDAEKDILFESSVGTTKTYVENQFSFIESNQISVLFEDSQGREDLYKMTKFNNNIGGGILKAETPKVMNFDMNEYYEQSQKGGFGLNHEKFKADGSSFFEIIFNNNAGSSNQDNNFKVGMQGVWARDPQEFYKD